MKFFSSKKININSISIPTFNWTNVKSDNATLVWVNETDTIALSVNFFNLSPDIPTIKDINVIRNFYRNSVSTAGGGLVEVDLLALKELTAIKTIFKFPNQPQGVTYIGSFIIPFEKYSYVIKIQAIESGITGIRDSIVADMLMNKGLLVILDSGIEGWSSDPYNKEFRKGILMNKSEEQQYDPKFPKHPLSEVRRILDEIKFSITFKPEIMHLEKYKK